jgi:hypothetical protein
MTDILIKSFNRAYYLDRCLFSIYKFIEGEFQIKILDDGTPEKYLNKIQAKYPEIEILKSKNYNEKNKLVEQKLPINGFEIPTDLWKSAVKNSSEFVSVIEDDVWFTRPVSISGLVEEMKKNDLVLIKIAWISNRKMKSAFLENLSAELTGIKPEVFTAPKILMNALFENKYKIYTLFYYLRILKKDFKNEYWVMNALLAGIYQKDYWLKIWENVDGKVDEAQQLKNAIQWFRKNKKNPVRFAKLKELKINTTYTNSATNSYHNYHVNLDMNVFNQIMNEAWIQGKLDALNNFPKDISESTFIKLLKQENNPKCLAENWMKWAEIFKQQYRKQQVAVD